MSHFQVVWRKESSDVPLTIGETIFSPESNMAIQVQKISEHVCIFCNRNIKKIVINRNRKECQNGINH
jgi:hypothetical protein